MKALADPWNGAAGNSAHVVIRHWLRNLGDFGGSLATGFD